MRSVNVNASTGADADPVACDNRAGEVVAGSHNFTVPSSMPKATTADPLTR